ncbi:hypothetical protein SESBI_50934 [Sesbania bispinosa]|nr:hypothetical protein SESBI_50934 [Sesbania bispinosa]
MARVRPSETSPGSSSVLPNENVVEPMSRSISLAILPKLPSPRAIPANADFRRWLPGVPLAERPFDTSVITFSDNLFSSFVAFSSVGCSYALLRYSISSTPSLELGPSLLRSRIMTEQFPWSSINFVSKCFQPSGWAEWVNHVFCTDKPFVSILARDGIAYAIKGSPFLGVHKRSDDLTTLVQRWRSIRVKKLALRHASASPSTVKESMSPVVFTPASLLAEGVCLPLASFYLGGLYGRLDQLQEQMHFSYGRFSINSCVDVVFLQIFLYERFPCYGPVRRVLKPPCGENEVSEYRVQGWFLGCPRLPLVYVIDDENRFVFRPYTSAFVPGVEDRVGRVLDEWVVYQRRLKASIAFFEGVKSTSPPHELLILLIDPYYVTSSVDYDKSDTPARARVKTTPSQKGKAKLCVSAPPFKKVPKKAPSSAKRPFSQVSAPRRSSERLRARPI